MKIIKLIGAVVLFASTLFATATISSQIGGISGISHTSGTKKIRSASTASGNSLMGGTKTLYGSFIPLNLNNISISNSATLNAAENQTASHNSDYQRSYRNSYLCSKWNRCRKF